jgi:hypothetical protein
MTELSPQAQAVLDAFGKSPLHGDYIAENLMHGALPAALRAAADQVVPETTTPWNSTLTPMISAREVHAKFLAIAAELEGGR